MRGHIVGQRPLKEDTPPPKRQTLLGAFNFSRLPRNVNDNFTFYCHLDWDKWALLQYDYLRIFRSYQQYHKIISRRYFVRRDKGQPNNTFHFARNYCTIGSIKRVRISHFQVKQKVSRFNCIVILKTVMFRARVSVRRSYDWKNPKRDKSGAVECVPFVLLVPAHLESVIVCDLCFWPFVVFVPAHFEMCPHIIET